MSIEAVNASTRGSLASPKSPAPEPHGASVTCGDMLAGREAGRFGQAIRGGRSGVDQAGAARAGVTGGPAEEDGEDSAGVRVAATARRRSAASSGVRSRWVSASNS